MKTQIFALVLFSMLAGLMACGQSQDKAVTNSSGQDKTHTNSIGVEMVLIPDGSFMMGGTLLLRKAMILKCRSTG